MSFDDAYDWSEICFLPCPSVPVPIIAPIWADLDFSDEGRIYYRSTQDPGLLDQVRQMIADVNPGMSDYEPTLAVIVTWFEAKFFDYVSSNHIAAVTSSSRQYTTATFYSNFIHVSLLFRII